jgi:uncharacterized protein
MHAHVETRRPALIEVCRRFGVRKLEVFGSASGTDFDPQRSDVDVLVRFSDVSSVDPMGEYFGLKVQLEGVLGRPVDLLVDGAVRNPYVLAGINATRQLIYAA